MSDQLDQLQRRLATNYKRYNSNKDNRRNWLGRMMTPNLVNHSDGLDELSLIASERDQHAI